MTANFGGTVTLAGQPHTSASKLDFFIADLDDKTVPNSVKTFGAGKSEIVAAISADADGNRYLAGYYKDALNFGCMAGQLYSMGTDHFDIFVAKLTPENECLWSRSYGPASASEAAAGNTIALAIAVGSDGNPVLAGTYSGQLQLGDDTYNAKGHDIFVAKLDENNGAAIWSKTFADGEGSSGVARALAITGNAEIVVVGDFSGPFDFGAGTVTADHTVSGAIGAGRAFALKLNKEGALMWSRVFEGDGSHAARSVSVDSSGVITVFGDFTGCIDLGMGGFESKGGSNDLPGEHLFAHGGGGDLFVTQLDSDGNHISSGTYGDAKSQNARQVIVMGNVTVVAGDFKGTLDFGAIGKELISTAGSSDIFLATITTPD